MHIPELMLEVLKQDGVVAIATQGEEGPHLVNTWNGYVQVAEDGRLLIPAGGMRQTEANLAVHEAVLLTLGSSQVPGRNGPGTGFLIEGRASFLASGPDFESLKARFAWARATLAVTITSVTQTL